MNQQEKKGFMFATLAAFSNATMALFAKLAVGVNVETIVFFRNFICFTVVLILVFSKKDFLKTKRFGLHLFRALCGLLAVYSYYYAIKHLPLVNAIVLANTSSLFIPLVVFVWLSTKIPMRRVVAVIIGFIGVILILKPDVGRFTEIASLVGLFGGLCIATAMVGVRQLTKTDPTEVIIFYFFLIATIVSFFPMAFNWQSVPLQKWVYILGTGIFGTCFQFFLTRAYKYAPATKASCLMYLSVVFGGIYGFFIFDTIPGFWHLIGYMLIILGGVLALFDPKQPTKMSKKPRNF